MSRKNNILLVANWDSDVGYAWWLMENFWIAISSEFTNESRSCFISFPRITTIPAAIQEAGIPSFELDMRTRTIRNQWEIFRFLNLRRIGYIYLSDYPPTSFFYFVLRVIGVKRIVVHDHTPGQRERPTGTKRLLKVLVRRMPWINADLFIAVTDYVRSRHIEVTCIPESKSKVAQNGIHPIDLATSNPTYAQEAFNIPRERYIVVTTGRATHYKGIDFFIRCAEQVIHKRGHNEFHFLFCGDGPDMQEFRDLARTLDLDSHFTFAGNRQDVRQILPSCDIGFHAAVGEVGYSLSILEYMSAGLLTIVPDSPSTSLATIHKKNGLLYPSRDIQKAADSIVSMLDKETTRTLQNNARIDVQNTFHISSTNQQLLQLLEPVFLE